MTSVLASGPWYASPPAVFTLTVGGLFLGALSIFLTMWVGRPRRLRFALLSDTPLLASKISPGDELEVRVRGDDQPINDPHVVGVRLRRTGPLDVKPADFTDGLPLAINVGATIVKQLGDSPTRLTVSTDGQSILIGPNRIPFGSRYTISVLTDGPVRQLSHDSELADVRVVIERAEPRRASRTQRVVTWVVVALIAIYLLTDPNGMAYPFKAAFRGLQSVGASTASYVNNLSAVGLILVSALIGAGGTLIIVQLFRRRSAQP